MKNLILKRGDSIASRRGGGVVGGKHLLGVNGYLPLNRETLDSNFLNTYQFQYIEQGMAVFRSA